MIALTRRDFLVMSTQSEHLDSGYPKQVIDLDVVLHLQEKSKAQVHFHHLF